MLCDWALKTWNANQKQKDAPRPATFQKSRVNTSTHQSSQAQIRRDVRSHAQNRCEICHSTYAIEIDHRIPQALGGSSEPDNLRLLCRSCNQRAAVRIFGAEKMSQWLD